MLARSGHRIVWKAALVAGFVAAAATGARAAAKPQDASNDEAAIRASAEAYQKAFNKHDAKALADSWAADGEMVDELGRTFRGREAIEQEFEAIFDEHAGAEIEVAVDSVKFVTPDVAVEQGTTWARSKNGASGPTKYTAVHVKRDGRWLLSSVSESRPATVSSAEHLASLEWMVGKWKADLPEGKTYSMSCDWLPGHSFLSRTFTVEHGSETLSSGTQIIGWNPVTGQINSWTFDSAGGIGHELWQDQGSKWEIAASSMLQDGSTSLATNEMEKIDHDAFTWKSTERTLNGQSLPDTSELRVERVDQ